MKSLHLIRKISLLLLLCVLFADNYAFAQTADTAVQATDTVVKTATADTAHTINALRPITDTVVTTRKFKFEPNPKKAGLYSAIVPGLGQIYDRKYWKLPIIYAGLGVAVYFIQFNSNNYQTYRKAYVSRLENELNGRPDNDKFVGQYSTDNLKQLQDDSKRYLDLTVLITGVGYMAQVVDAIVYAHLKNFDISQDISMKVSPVILPNGVGIGLVFNTK